MEGIRKRKCRNAICACTGWCRYTEEEWQERQQKQWNWNRHQRYLIKRDREQKQPSTDEETA